MVELLFIEQNPQQLHDGQGWMRVIGLDRGLSRELLPIKSFLSQLAVVLVSTDDVLYGC